MAAYAVELMTRYEGSSSPPSRTCPGLSALGRDDEEALGEAQRALGEHVRSGEALPEPAARGGTLIEAPLIVLA